MRGLEPIQLTILGGLMIGFLFGSSPSFEDERDTRGDRTIATAAAGKVTMS